MCHSLWHRCTPAQSIVDQVLQVLGSLMSTASYPVLTHPVHGASCNQGGLTAALSYNQKKEGPLKQDMSVHSPEGSFSAAWPIAMANGNGQLAVLVLGARNFFARAALGQPWRLLPGQLRAQPGDIDSRPRGVAKGRGVKSDAHGASWAFGRRHVLSDPEGPCNMLVPRRLAFDAMSGHHD